MILHCEENGRFKNFFRTVITILKIKIEIKSVMGLCGAGGFFGSKGGATGVTNI